METKKDRIRGIIGTVLFHVLILFIFMLTGFRTPLPLPEEIGVEIEGGSSLGLGDNPQMDAASAAQNKPNYSSDYQNYATQNTEETYNIKKIKENTSNPETKEPEKPVKIVPKWNSNQSGESSSQGSGSYGSSSGGGSGNNPGDGKGTGIGSGTGIGFELLGRSSRYLPEPDKKFTEAGTIVVTIWVDRDGNVTRASAGARGSTSTSPQLRNLALEAAKKSKFQTKADAPEEQTGSITYVFRLD